MKAIVAAIHGIMTNQTDPSWPDKFDAWMYERDPQVKVLKKEYRAGPFPRWNCWVRDPLLARGLANELELFLKEQRATLKAQNALSPLPFAFPPPLWLVAHSNGAVIALLVTKRLIERGYQIGGLILTGAACEADIYKNEIFKWYCELNLGAAIAYSSADDEVVAGDARAPHNWLEKARDWLWGKLMWPYGCLGRSGWLIAGKLMEEELMVDGRRSLRPSSASQNSQLSTLKPLTNLFTRWYPGGHSRYFTPEHIEGTFEQIYRDICARKTGPQGHRAAELPTNDQRPMTNDH